MEKINEKRKIGVFYKNLEWADDFFEIFRWLYTDINYHFNKWNGTFFCNVLNGPSIKILKLNISNVRGERFTEIYLEDGISIEDFNFVSDYCFNSKPKVIKTPTEMVEVLTKNAD